MQPPGRSADARWHNPPSCPQSGLSEPPGETKAAKTHRTVTQTRRTRRNQACQAWRPFQHNTTGPSESRRHRTIDVTTAGPIGGDGRSRGPDRQGRSDHHPTEHLSPVHPSIPPSEFHPPYNRELEGVPRTVGGPALTRQSRATVTAAVSTALDSNASAQCSVSGFRLPGARGPSPNGTQSDSARRRVRRIMNNPSPWSMARRRPWLSLKLRLSQ